MKPIVLCRHDLSLSPESSRVIIRPFIPAETHRITTIIGRALALTETEVGHALDELRAEFDTRHFDVESVMLHHYQKVLPHVFTERKLSRNRRLLIGALFSGEYALESAALFNPSIVPHPDQTGVPDGGLRFIMSLRATGEGHISSIEFRSGMINANGCITMDEISRFLTVPEVLPNPRYHKRRFVTKLHEMCPQNEFYAAVIAPLGDWFTLSELKKSIAVVKEQIQPNTLELTRVLERVQWLAESNYELRFPPHLAMSERIIFPV